MMRLQQWGAFVGAGEKALVGGGRENCEQRHGDETIQR